MSGIPGSSTVPETGLWSSVLGAFKAAAQKENLDVPGLGDPGRRSPPALQWGTAPSVAPAQT